MSVVLRPTTPNDLEFVVALEADPETAPYIVQWTTEEHQTVIDSAVDEHWIVTNDSGESVGFVILQQAHTDRVELRRIAIAVKGRGYGRAALRATKRLVMDERGAGTLWLDVYDFNERAAALYRSEGWVEVERCSAVEACGAEGGTAIVMELRAG